MAAGATYEPIATTTLSSSTVSYTFSSIPGTYTDLKLVSNHLAAGDTGWLSIRFNGDTGSNYSNTYLRGTGSAAQTGRATSATNIQIGGYSDATSTEPALTVLDIMGYSNSLTYKTSLIRYSSNSSLGGTTYALVGLWRNTAAITSLTITRENWNFISGTTFTLYGIAAA